MDDACEGDDVLEGFNNRRGAKDDDENDATTQPKSKHVYFDEPVAR